MGETGGGGGVRAGETGGGGEVGVGETGGVGGRVTRRGCRAEGQSEGAGLSEAEPDENGG